jgi:hypothetical protein
MLSVVSPHVRQPPRPPAAFAPARTASQGCCAYSLTHWCQSAPHGSHCELYKAVSKMGVKSLELLAKAFVVCPCNGRTYNDLVQYQEHCLHDSEHLDTEQQLKCESVRFEEGPLQPPQRQSESRRKHAVCESASRFILCQRLRSGIESPSPFA